MRRYLAKEISECPRESSVRLGEAHQMVFRMLANGVTPIPAPTKTLASNLKTSSDAEPKGPSIWDRGESAVCHTKEEQRAP